MFTFFLLEYVGAMHKVIDILLITVLVYTGNSVADDHVPDSKSQTALPFAFLDKLPFLNKDFSTYEPIPHDDKSLKELVFNDKQICSQTSFEEIIFYNKCFREHSTLREKNLVLPNSVAKKLRCNPISRNASEVASVQLLNSTELLELLGKNGSNLNHCTVVLFYAAWCVFSVRMSPAYNALARVFPSLDVVAIDAYNFGQLNSRFGSLSVPTVMVFHNGKAFSKFNGSDRTLESFTGYIFNTTGMEPNRSVAIEDFDFEGPLSSQLSKDNDYALWLSWLFIIVCIIGSIVRSEKGLQFYVALKDLLTHQAEVPPHID